MIRMLMIMDCTLFLVYSVLCCLDGAESSDVHIPVVFQKLYHETAQPCVVEAQHVDGLPPVLPWKAIKIRLFYYFFFFSVLFTSYLLLLIFKHRFLCRGEDVQSTAHSLCARSLEGNEHVRIKCGIFNYHSFRKLMVDRR